MEKPEIRVLNAALEERSNGDIIIRGSIAADCLQHLKTDDYQREVLAPIGGKKSKLQRGVESGVTLPDIELGMRGQQFTSRGNVITLHGAVYIIDGLQRVSALLAHMETDKDAATDTDPLGATIHLATTKEWEKSRFADLNQLRTPVSPNIILRNMRDKHPSVLTLYGLSMRDADFALYERVCWNQRMTRSELITASVMVRAARGIHSHIITKLANAGTSGKNYVGNVGLNSGEVGRATSASVGRAPMLLDRVAAEVGLQNYRANIKDYFELVDVCYGIRTVEYNQVSTHLRGNFISVLAEFLSRNQRLWKDGKRMNVDAKTRNRLKSFPINDPEIRRLCSAGSMVLPTLYTYLLNHMNKGKPASTRFK